MRGGRNKFGPMYKRDRALKQQAIRQQHHMIGCSDMKPDMSSMLSPTGPMPFSHPGMSSYIPQSSMMSMPPLTTPGMPSSVRHVPPLIEQLKSHEPNEKDIQEKVFAFAQYHFASADAKPKQELILGLCKLADHCLFLLVEWARGSLFFRELKVSTINLGFRGHLGTKLFCLLYSMPHITEEICIEFYCETVCFVSDCPLYPRFNIWKLKYQIFIVHAAL